MAFRFAGNAQNQKLYRNEPCAVVLVVISLCLIIGFDLRIELSLDKRVLLFA